MVECSFSLFVKKNVDKLVWQETLGILFANSLPVALGKLTYMLDNYWNLCSVKVVIREGNPSEIVSVYFGGFLRKTRVNYFWASWM
jgi:hypothetical protein